MSIFFLDQTVEKQAENLRNISSSYDHDKKKWTEAIISLQEKIKVNDDNAGMNDVKKIVVLLLFSYVDLRSICTWFVLQLMKSEHAQLSREAHECVDSIPELNKMVFAVQELGMLELQNLISIASQWRFELQFTSLVFILSNSYEGTNTIFLQLSSVKILKWNTMKRWQKEKSYLMKFRRLRVCSMLMSTNYLLSVDCVQIIWWEL